MAYRINTKCILSGYSPKNGEPRQVPISQSTTFKYDSSVEMGKLFDLEASGYFYTRLANPTNDAVAAKICEMEGGAVGHVCYMNKVPFAIIRSISDDFKFNKPENYEEFSQLAADRTVKALKKFIRMDD